MLFRSVLKNGQSVTLTGIQPVERVPQHQLEILSRNLKRLRAKRGWSQETLAERADIAPRYLQFIEAGDFGCSLAVLLRLRRALRCSWNRLLEGVE